MIVQTIGEEEKIMNDVRSKSLSEAFVNSFGAFPIGYCIGLIVLPLSVSWIEKDPFTVNVFITLIYASVSFLRIYYLRRFFARLGFDDNVIKLALKSFQKINLKTKIRIRPRISDEIA